MGACLCCGADIRIGALCRDHAAAIATCGDVTAEQIITIRAKPGATVWLIDQWGVTHDVLAGDVVGRSASDCAVAILHPTVSALHAQFCACDGGWLLVDRGSLNGTFVNDMAIRQRALRQGDRVRFGDIAFYFAQRAASAAAVDLGPGRTLPSKQRDLAFSAVLQRRGRQIELVQRAGGGLVRSGNGPVLEFARLEFALLAALAQRRSEARAPDLAYVSSRELADRLEFRSREADGDNVRELIRRVRKKFQTEGIDDLIESRQGAGYRLAWSIKPT